MRIQAILKNFLISKKEKKEKKEIIILTKSAKKSPRSIQKRVPGYCVAGIDVNTGDWIRLVGSGENNDESLIDSDLTNQPGTAIAGPLDRISVAVKRPVPNGCQTENWLIDEDSCIDIKGKADLTYALSLHPLDMPDYVYANTKTALNVAEAEAFDHSLILIPAKNLKVFTSLHKRKKINFTYNGRKYLNISLTDPLFFNQNDGELDYAFLVVSIPHIPYNNGLYYKFVAKIFKVSEKEYRDFLPEPESAVDYEESLTIGAAIEKYKDILSPLVVVAGGWDNDYCFAIQSEEAGLAAGVAFANGKPEFPRLSGST